METYSWVRPGESLTNFFEYTYKDFFVLSKNGQRALDVEVSSAGDSTIKVADLEDARR